MRNVQIYIALVLSLFATQVLAQGSTTKKVNIEVPGFISYGPQGQQFVPIANVSDVKTAIKMLGLTPDSIQFVAIIPVSASGVYKTTRYDQVYARAGMQRILPCYRWVAVEVTKLNLPIRNKVYVLTDVSTAAFDRNGKPKQMFNIPFIEPQNGKLSLGTESMGTLESFELITKISDTGTTETVYDVHYNWKSFTDEDSRIMVIMSVERIIGGVMD
jgi:hypothetical protein